MTTKTTPPDLQPSVVYLLKLFKVKFIHPAEQEEAKTSAEEACKRNRNHYPRLSRLLDDMAVDRAALLQPATRWPSDDEAPRRREDSPLSEEFESEDSSSSSEAVRLRLPPRRAERRREVRPRRIVDSDSEEDSSSSGLGGGAEITKNLYSVQVQMIKKVVNEESILDYEITES